MDRVSPGEAPDAGGNYGRGFGEKRPGAARFRDEVWVNDSHIAACWGNVKRMMENAKDGEKA